MKRKTKWNEGWIKRKIKGNEGWAEGLKERKAREKDVLGEGFKDEEKNQRIERLDREKDQWKWRMDGSIKGIEGWTEGFK